MYLKSLHLVCIFLQICSQLELVNQIVTSQGESILKIGYGLTFRAKTVAFSLLAHSVLLCLSVCFRLQRCNGWVENFREVPAGRRRDGFNGKGGVSRGGCEGRSVKPVWLWYMRDTSQSVRVINVWRRVCMQLLTGVEPRPVAISLYSWLMTVYGFLAG